MKKFAVLTILFVIGSGFLFAQQNTLAVNANILEFIGATFPDGALIEFENIVGSSTGNQTSTTTTLNIKSNKPHWTVAFTSANAGKLVAGAGIDPIDYKLRAVITTNSVTAWGSNKLTSNVDSFTALPLSGDTVKLAVASGNGKTPVNGLNFTVDAQLTMQTGDAIFYEAGVVFSDTVTVTITSP